MLKPAGTLLRQLPVCLWICALLFSGTGSAQTCNVDASIASYSTSPYQFTTFNSLVSGGTASMYISAQLSTNQGTCNNWKMTMKATGDFANGAYFLDLKYVSIKFNTVVNGPAGSQIGIPTNPFQLALNETTIIPRSEEALHANKYPYYEIKYDMIIQGGNQLLALNNGEYSTNIIFTIYDNRGNVISTSTPTKIAFQVQYAASNSSSLLLLNGADNVTLRFNNAADIANGVTLVKSQSMSVTSYSGHQIIVKAASSNLVAAGSMNTIPVSTIRLSLKAPSGQPNIICYSQPLSMSPRVVVDNPMTDYTYQTVLYDLTYSIPGKDPNISAAAMGTYTTSLVFVIVPK